MYAGEVSTGISGRGGERKRERERENVVSLSILVTLQRYI